MKKHSTLLMALLLTAVVFTACGCRNNAPMDTIPTTTPTTEMTKPTTMPTTMPTTEATMETGDNSATNATIDNGNGPLPTDSTGAAGNNARGRSIPGGR